MPNQIPLTANIFWIVWGSIVAGLTAVTLLVPSAELEEANANLRFIPLLPLVLSLIVRFVILPRMRTLSKAFPVFVAGCALAEGSGLLGKFLSGGTDAQLYFGAALAMLLFHVPLFAKRLAP